MVEAIWDSIAMDEENIELSNETKMLLDKRLTDHLENPTEGSSWEEARARIKGKL